MAERSGPEGEKEGRDPVESSQQEDRSSGVEHVADHGVSDSAESGATELAAEDSETAAGGAEVLPFRRRENDDEEPLAEADELDEDSEPIDLAALQADDALLDALGGTNPDVPGSAGDDGPSLEELLVAWRQDVDAVPIGDLVDVDTAAAAIAEGRRPRRRLRRRHLVPVASAAAVLMIAFTGVGVAARDALPGDMLWGVAQVLYTDHAQAVQAATSARENLRTAEALLEQGDREAAEAALRSAKEQMRQVDAEHGLEDLRAAHASLAARLEEERETPTYTPTREQSGDWGGGGGDPDSTVAPTPTFEPPPSPSPTGITTPPPSSSQPSESTTAPSETSGSSEESTTSGWEGLFPQQTTSQ